MLQSPDGEIKIHPTHTCFDDVLDRLTELVKEDPKLAHSDRYLVVHGILTDSSGDQYSHAWIEEGDIVWHSGILDGVQVWCGFDKLGYYKEMGLVECTKYTPKQVCVENIKSNNFGPWIQKYRNLCRNYNPITDSSS